MSCLALSCCCCFWQSTLGRRIRCTRRSSPPCAFCGRPVASGRCDPRPKTMAAILCSSSCCFSGVQPPPQRISCRRDPRVHHADVVVPIGPSMMIRPYHMIAVAPIAPKVSPEMELSFDAGDVFGGEAPSLSIYVVHLYSMACCDTSWSIANNGCIGFQKKISVVKIQRPHFSLSARAYVTQEEKRFSK